MREPSSLSRQILERALAKAQVHIGPCVEMDSREATREAVALGMGVGVMGDMEFMTEDQRTISVPIRDARLVMSEYVACLGQRQNLRIVRAFFSLCKEKVKW
jgi:LysR family transcriptional regulator, low CO2-responsive transcriptional regulator